MTEHNFLLTFIKKIKFVYKIRLKKKKLKIIRFINNVNINIWLVKYLQ